RAKLRQACAHSVRADGVIPSLRLGVPRPAHSPLRGSFAVQPPIPRHRTATATCLPSRFARSLRSLAHPPSELRSDEPALAILVQTSRESGLWRLLAGLRPARTAFGTLGEQSPPTVRKSEIAFGTFGPALLPRAD